MIKGFTVGVVVISFCIGIGVGYWLTPEYQMQNIQMKQSHDLGSVDQWIDLRYIDGMIAHHLSAIYLLEQAQQYSGRQEIKDLATTVITADKNGIKSLYEYKKDWYGNERKISEFNQVHLGKSDDKFDLRFLNALLSHHQEAIEKAKEISSKSNRKEVLNLADDVTTSLTANATQLKKWRKEWYGIE